jgi:hypothetical protein
MTTEVSNVGTLYLRSVPDEVVREAKAAAARRGVTLAAFVSEALASTLGLQTPGGPVARGPSGAPTDRASGGAASDRARPPAGLEAEMAWYDAHRRTLIPRYRGQYLAIANQKVIDHDKDFDRLARRVFARLGPRPVFMPKCVDGERVVTLATPKVARA